MFEWEPIVGVIFGTILISLFLYLHLRRKSNIIHWISEHIYGNQFMSERSAESLFNVTVSFLAAIGGIWIILSLYYLTNR